MCTPPNRHPEVARRLRPEGSRDERVVERQQQLTPGARVRVVSWAPSKVPGLEDGEPNYPPGSVMTVRHVDDWGTIWGTWEHLGGLTGIGVTIGDEVEPVPDGFVIGRVYDRSRPGREGTVHMVSADGTELFVMWDDGEEGWHDEGGLGAVPTTERERELAADRESLARRTEVTDGGD